MLLWSVLCLLLALPASAYEKLPKGSFLLRPAPSARSLAAQVRASRLLATRYGRVFHLSPEIARRSFRTFRLIRLPQDAIMQVHYVRPGEEIGYKLRRVRKGTLVFALPDGTPVLAQVCGNPLRRHIPDPGLPLASIPDFDPEEPLRAPEPTRALVFHASLRLAQPEQPAFRSGELAPPDSGLPTPENPPGAATPGASPNPLARVVPWGGTRMVLPLLFALLPDFLLPDEAGGNGPFTGFIPSPDADPPDSLPPTPGGLTPPAQKDYGNTQIGDWTKPGSGVTLPGPGLPALPGGDSPPSPGEPSDPGDPDPPILTIPQPPRESPAPFDNVPEPGPLLFAIALGLGVRHWISGKCHAVNFRDYR